MSVRSIVDSARSKAAHRLAERVEAPVFETPKEARVFACERWEHAPVMAWIS